MAQCSNCGAPVEHGGDFCSDGCSCEFHNGERNPVKITDGCTVVRVGLNNYLAADAVVEEIVALRHRKCCLVNVLHAITELDDPASMRNLARAAIKKAGEEE